MHSGKRGIAGMNLAVLVGAVGVVGTGIYLYTSRTPADVYPMPVNAAYARLVDVDFGPMSEGEVALDTKKTASGNDKDVVTWVHHGDMAHYECTMWLRPLPDDTAKTHVAVSCDGGGAGDGAAAGMAKNLYRSGIVKRVDATLRGIPYVKGELGSMSVPGWPDEGVDTYPAAA
jgi:hypothetical protein